MKRPRKDRSYAPEVKEHFCKLCQQMVRVQAQRGRYRFVTHAMLGGMVECKGSQKPIPASELKGSR